MKNLIATTLLAVAATGLVQAQSCNPVVHVNTALVQMSPQETEMALLLMRELVSELETHDDNPVTYPAKDFLQIFQHRREAISKLNSEWLSRLDGNKLYGLNSWKKAWPLYE